MEREGKVYFYSRVRVSGYDSTVDRGKHCMINGKRIAGSDFARGTLRDFDLDITKLLKGDIEDFCDDLVRKVGVLLLPGTIYDDSGNRSS